jgi:Tol biopolymer transport system component
MEPAPEGDPSAVGLAAVETAQGLSVRKLPPVKVDYDYYSEELSPDGTKMALAHMGATAMNISVYEFASQRTTHLTRYEKNYDRDWLWSLVWSPDGTSVVFTSVQADGNGNSELRLVTPGRPERILYRDSGPPGSSLYATDWLRDGSAIVAVRNRPDNSQTVGLISVAGGAFRALRSVRGGPQREYGDRKAKASPDGRFVVFEAGPAGSREIQIAATQGQSLHRLTDHPGDDAQPRWSPDGRHIVFLSQRHGRWALWGIAVENGRTAGRPFMIKEGLEGTMLLNWPVRGQLWYRTAFEVFDLFTIAVDPATGAGRGKPRQLAYPRTGGNRSPTWSPDGKRLAFLSTAADDRTVLVVMSRSGGTAPEFALPVAQVPKYLRLRWLPDSTAVSFAGVNTQGAATLFRFDLGRSRWTQSLLPPGAPKLWTTVEWQRGGASYLTTVSAGNGRPERIVEHDLASGRTRVVWTPQPPVAHIDQLRLSPDFRSLAFRATTAGKAEPRPAGLMVLDLKTRQARMITPTQNRSGFPYLRQNPPAWSPDGQHLVITAQGEKDVELQVIPVAGGAAKSLDLEGKRAFSPPHWSPDGKQIAFAGRLFTDSYWVMEDFLPARTATAVAPGQ